MNEVRIGSRPLQDTFVDARRGRCAAGCRHLPTALEPGQEHRVPTGAGPGRGAEDLHAHALRTARSARHFLDDAVSARLTGIGLELGLRAWCQQSAGLCAVTRSDGVCEPGGRVLDIAVRRGRAPGEDGRCEQPGSQQSQGNNPSLSPHTTVVAVARPARQPRRPNVPRRRRARARGGVRQQDSSSRTGHRTRSLAVASTRGQADQRGAPAAKTPSHFSRRRHGVWVLVAHPGKHRCISAATPIGARSCDSPKAGRRDTAITHQQPMRV